MDNEKELHYNINIDVSNYDYWNILYSINVPFGSSFCKSNGYLEISYPRKTKDNHMAINAFNCGTIFLSTLTH